MSSITTNPARAARVSRRTQIVAEAVVSAYIQDVSQPPPPPERVAAGLPFLARTAALARTSRTPPDRRRAVDHRPRPAMELVA